MKRILALLTALLLPSLLGAAAEDALDLTGIDLAPATFAAEESPDLELDDAGLPSDLDLDLTEEDISLDLSPEGGDLALSAPEAVPVSNAEGDWFEADGIYYCFYSDKSENIKVLGTTDEMRQASEIVIPARVNGYPVTMISWNAFEEYTSLKKITLPDTLYSICSYAFCGCKALKDINIPDCITFIGDSAFEGCISLTDITFSDDTPLSLYLCNSIFRGCTSLKRLYIPIDPYYVEVEGPTIEGCTSLTELTAPISILYGYAAATEGKRAPLESVTLIARPGIYEGTLVSESLFEGCKSLKSVTLLDGFTRIGSNAFKNCTALTDVTLPDSLTRIDDYAFKNCTALKRMSLPTSLINFWPKGIFSGCTSLTELAAPANHLYDLADCKNLKTVIVLSKPNDETDVLNNGAFSGCVSLSNVSLPDNINQIRDDAFKGCVSLKKIDLPDGLREIWSSAFEGCTALTTIDIPSGVTEISMSTFKDCTSLMKVNLPKGLTDIWYSAFENCTALTDINLPKGLSNILDNAFKNCVALKNISLPKGLTNIREGTFENCVSLTNITFPKGLTRIYAKAFSGCRRLEKITFPESVEYLGRLAFEGCTSLVDVTFPGIRDIYYGAFFGCSKLRTVNLDYCDGTIDTHAFACCKALRSVIIGKIIDTLGKEIFTCSDAFTETKDGQYKLNGTKYLPPRLILYGYEGSEVQAYAKKAGIPFKSLVEELSFLQDKKVKLAVGEKLTLTPCFEPESSKTALTWTSSDPKVATVTQKGVVKALKKGTTTITARTGHGDKTTCRITVPTAPKTVKFAKASYTVKVGKTVKLSVRLNPAKSKTVLAFSSGNKKVATVSKDGRVKGLKKGAAIITVRTSNGLKAKVKVTVTD